MPDSTVSFASEALLCINAVIWLPNAGGPLPLPLSVAFASVAVSFRFLDLCRRVCRRRRDGGERYTGNAHQDDDCDHRYLPSVHTRFILYQTPIKRQSLFSPFTTSSGSVRTVHRASETPPGVRERLSTDFSRSVLDAGSQRLLSSYLLYSALDRAARPGERWIGRFARRQNAMGECLCVTMTNNR